MKIIASTLLALLTATFGCATDDSSDEHTTTLDNRRDVISDSRPDIEESIKTDAPAPVTPKLDNGRQMWVEVIDTDNSRTIQLHHVDADTGIDLVEILDEDGTVQRVIETRYAPSTLETSAQR